MMRARGADFSSHQRASAMQYARWRVLGFLFAWVRLSIGSLRDTEAAAHIAGLRAAGWLIGGYHALHEAAPPRAQARLFVQLLDELLPHSRLPAMLDVERTNLAEWHVTEFIDEFQRLSDRELAIYTSASAWHRIVGRGLRLWARRLRLWAAAYPYDARDDQPQPMDPASVARRSNPPPESYVVPVPDPWALPAGSQPAAGWDWHQHTGHGRLDGYDRDLDLNVFAGTAAELLALYGETIVTTPLPIPTPPVATGTKLGFHQTGTGPAMQYARAAVAGGAHFAVGKFVDDLGGLFDLARDSPRTLRLARLTHAELEAAPGMDERPSDDTLRSMAARIIDHILHRTSLAERQAAHWWEPWNEPRPHTVAGYERLAELMWRTMDAAEAVGLRVALFGFNAGTPEWDEIIAILRTGVMERAILGGHIWTCHAGLLKLPNVSGQPDTLHGLMGGIIRNPTTGATVSFPDTDPLVLRHRLWQHAADQHGWRVAPLVISEFYPALEHPLTVYPVNDIAGRYAWLDHQLAQDPYVLGVTPFTLGGGDRWSNEDHAFAYSAIVEHVIRVRDRANHVPPAEPEEEDYMIVTLPVPPELEGAVIEHLTALGDDVRQNRRVLPYGTGAPWWATQQPPYQVRAAVSPLKLFKAPAGALDKEVNATWDIDVREVKGDWLRVTGQQAAGAVGLWCRAQDVILL